MERLQLIRDNARMEMEQALERADGENPEDDPGNPCENDPELEPENLLRNIMWVIDHPHGDDGACENPAVNALDGVVIHALLGIADALGVEL